MKVKQLIEELNKIEDKEREIQILIGNDDISNYGALGCETFSLMHTEDNEQCVEIFCELKNVYNIY